MAGYELEQKIKGTIKVRQVHGKPSEDAFTSDVSVAVTSSVIPTVAPYFTLACFMCNA